MNSFKIRVNSPEHSEKIQKKLFELGYSWCSISKKIQFTDADFLYVNRFNANEITYSHGYGNEDYFNSQKMPEVELIETITYEFREIPKRNVVNVGGISYYEDDLAEALKNIKPI